MDLDKIPYLIFNTFGIIALIISKVYSNHLLKAKFQLLNNNLNSLKMSTEQKFTEHIQRINSATTHLAGQVETIVIPEIKAQGLPAQAETSIISKLKDLSSRLASIGTSPDNPLPGVVGSSTPVTLGDMPQQSNTAPTEAGNNTNDTNTQPAITNENTGSNTPKSDGAKTEPDKANALMNPFPQPLVTLPGDKTTNVNGGDSIQVGKQANANNGDTETDPNKDSNSANDEDTFITPEALTATQTDNADSKATKGKGSKKS